MAAGPAARGEEALLGEVGGTGGGGPRGGQREHARAGVHARAPAPFPSPSTPQPHPPPSRATGEPGRRRSRPRATARTGGDGRPGPHQASRFPPGACDRPVPQPPTRPPTPVTQPDPNQTRRLVSVGRREHFPTSYRADSNGYDDKGSIIISSIDRTNKYGELGMKNKYGHEQASRARRLAVTIGKRAKATWISHPASRRRGACVGGSLVPPRVKAPRPTQASLAAPHAFSSECGRKPAALPTSIFNPHRARARACHVLRAKNLHGRCKRRRGRLFRHRGRGMRPRRCCGAGRSGRHWRLAGVCTVLRRRARTMRSNAISRATHGAAAVDRKLMTQL